MSLIKPLRSTRAPLKCASVILLATALAGCQSVQAVDSAAATPAPKNIIVMINDGAGWGTWDAAAYWQYGSREGAPYADFPQRFGVTTFPLNSSSQPTGETNQSISYDPVRAWDATEVPAADLPFVGY